MIKILSKLLGKIKKWHFAGMVFLLALFTNAQIFAASLQNDILPSMNGGVINSAVQTGTLEGLLSFVKDSIFGLLAIIIVGVFIFIGSRLVIARGNAEEFKKSLLQLMYAIIGLFIISAAYLAVKLVAGLSIN